MEKLTKQTKVDSDDFYRGLKVEGVDLRGLLWPLACLSPRERAVFTEYHYWNTHMAIILGGVTLYVTTSVLEVKLDGVKADVREVKQQVDKIYNDIYKPSMPGARGLNE